MLDLVEEQPDRSPTSNGPTARSWTCSRASTPETPDVVLTPMEVLDGRRRTWPAPSIAVDDADTTVWWAELDGSTRFVDPVEVTEPIEPRRRPAALDLPEGLHTLELLARGGVRRRRGRPTPRSCAAPSTSGSRTARWSCLAPGTAARLVLRGDAAEPEAGRTPSACRSSCVDPVVDPGA